MLQNLGRHWTLDIDPAFSREENSDGYTFFERQGMLVSAIVYCSEFDPEQAIASFLERRPRSDEELAFRKPSDGIAGRGFLKFGDHANPNMSPGWELFAVTSSRGELVQLYVWFQDKTDLEIAVSIWHSLQQSVPDWIEMCCQARPPLAALRKGLESRCQYIQQAVEVIRQRGQMEVAMRVLFAAATSDRPEVRLSVCQLFQLLADASEQVLTTLRSILNDDSVEVRSAAAFALLALGQPEGTVVPSMIEGLHKYQDPLPKGNERIANDCSRTCLPDRFFAAEVLASIGEAARPAKGELAELLFDESAPVRQLVARALVNLGEPMSSVVLALTDGVRSPEMSDRERVELMESLLDEYGSWNDELLPILTGIVADTSDFTTKIVAMRLLTKLGHKALSAVELVERTIIEKSDKFDHYAARAIEIEAALTLIRLGAKVEIARPVLLAAAMDEDSTWTKGRRAELLAALNSLDDCEEG